MGPRRYTYLPISQDCLKTKIEQTKNLLEKLQLIKTFIPSPICITAGEITHCFATYLQYRRTSFFRVVPGTPPGIFGLRTRTVNRKYDRKTEQARLRQPILETMRMQQNPSLLALDTVFNKAAQLATLTLDAGQTKELLEEENWEWYEPGLFYPVRIGEVFKSRYQVIGKLGYGSRSTAWLCRDLNGHKYVTLKVCERETASIRREMAAYDHLSTIMMRKEGALLIRELLDTFKLQGSQGEHHCFVHEPLGMSMETLRRLCPGHKLTEELLKLFLIHLFLALDFLHTDAKMIHADLQAMNVHLRIEDESILRYFEESEMSDPSPRKVYGDRVIYESRGLRAPKSSGRPVLCDFDTYTGDIQPYVYRAPEVILGIPWTYSVDIWNVGVMIWDIFENKHLFNAQDGNGESLSLYHLAEMVAILGPPPLDYLRRSRTPSAYTKNSLECFDDAESSEENLEGENKILFLKFIRKMLRWVPEERHSAKQLLEDPWLRS
ncbi:kinase-like protein [Gymnopus androsaceus JB14]|uniref:non-specific serine/threonine protein kinase n=1 Tax=Gymnopus androsaceus JB14 TaxID=1447944 RepID=A0A6A4I620_9AGAR|nr:kinase-like protein [Gymnopus androsaceus JB14]